MDAATAAILQSIIVRESRSLFQYVSESFPWATPEEQGVLASLNRMIAEERQGAAALGRLLVRRRHQAPYVGPYPVTFTNVNYVSLDHLLPQLIQHERVAVREMENDVAHLAAPDVREQVEAVLVMKRRHIDELEKMASVTREATVR